jgi:hypothetical protein
LLFVNSFNPQSDLRPKDRRRYKRSRTIKTGHLVFGDVSPTVLDCMVIDISDEGARVETSIMMQVPDLLTLVLNDEIQHRCIKRWATGDQIGLEFLPKKG